MPVKAERITRRLSEVTPMPMRRGLSFKVTHASDFNRDRTGAPLFEGILHNAATGAVIAFYRQVEGESPIWDIANLVPFQRFMTFAASQPDEVIWGQTFKMDADRLMEHLIIDALDEIKFRRIIGLGRVVYLVEGDSPLNYVSKPIDYSIIWGDAIRNLHKGKRVWIANEDMRAFITERRRRYEDYNRNPYPQEIK